MALLFVGGDEVVELFLLEGTDGDILNLDSVTVSGGVWWKEKLRIPLAVDSGLTITSMFPPRAAEGDDQEPHGYITLSEAQTALIPIGQIASIKLVVVTGGDVMMSSYLMPMERVLP